MRFAFDTPAFSVQSYPHGGMGAQVHFREDSIVTAIYYPKSGDGREFIALRIETPGCSSDDKSGVVTMHVGLREATRLAETLNGVILTGSAKRERAA